MKASLWPAGLLLGIAGCAARPKPPPAEPIAKREVKESRLPRLMAPTGMVHGLTTRTLVLTYHDIIPRRDKSSVWFDCTVKEFREQLDWLQSKGAHFESVSSLWAHLAFGTPFPDNAVVLTFDDNYSGFLQYAVPLLHQRHIPAASFVHTRYVGSPVGRPKLTWDQLRSISQDPLFTVQSESASHPEDMGKQTQEQRRVEFEESRVAISDHLHTAAVYFAYPNGKFSPACLTEAHDAGYRLAFSEAWTPAEWSPSMFAVGRYVHTQYRRGWADCHPVTTGKPFAKP